MKTILPRLYSIQAKLSILLLIALLIILCGEIFSVYFSKRVLSSAELFVHGALPRIQLATALEKATIRLAGFSREITYKNTTERLQKQYIDLNSALEQVESLAASMAQDEATIDIPSLNFLSSSIRSQADTVFKLGTEISRQSQQVSLATKSIKNDIISLDRQLSNPDPNDDKIAQYTVNKESLLTFLSVTDKLTITTTKEELTRLRNVFRGNLKRLGTTISLPDDDPRKALVHNIITRVEDTFTLRYQIIDANAQLSHLVYSFLDLSDQLESLTGSYLEIVITRFQTRSANLIAGIKRFIKITLFFCIGSIFLLVCLYWLLVVRGFGRRLSMISKAMGGNSVEQGVWDLPLEGRDEITHMAEATDELLTKARKLRELATIDELTQIYNRRIFFDLASQEAKRAIRTKLSAVVLMLDIDHFKRLNDTYGHDFGDIVLHKTAQTCKQITREIDIFARYGGEEFALLLPETPMDQGTAIANRILTTLAALQFPRQNEAPVSITVSIGMAEAPLWETSVDEALKKADTALYQAKEGGRNRVVIYEK